MSSSSSSNASSGLSLGADGGRVSQPSHSEESQLLYLRQVPVCVKPATRDPFEAELTFSIVLRTVHSHQKQQILSFQITDECDLFFLQLLEITEADFHALKREQALHVDFAAFPQNVIELLELCCSGSPEAPAKHAAELVLSSTRHGTLHLFERNHFKNLQHLALQLREGNDAAVKKHLADRVIEFKGKSRGLDHDLSLAREQLAEHARELALLRDELQQAREQHSQTVNQLRTAHATELADTRAQALTTQQQLSLAAEEARRQLEREGRQALDVAQTKLEGVQANLRQEVDERTHAQTTNAQLKQQLERVQSELAAVKSEVVTLRERTRDHDATRFELDSALQKHKLFEQQLRDKDEMIDKLTTLYESGQKQKSTVEESLSMYKANFEKVDGQFKESCREIAKGNDIIQQLQSEIKQLKNKIKLKTTVIQQQEQVVLQKQQQLEDGQRALSQSHADLSGRNQKVRSLEAALQAAQRDLDESAQKLASNEQVIAFLNKEITESKVSSAACPTSSPFSSSLSFRPVVPIASPTSFNPASSSASSSRYLRYDLGDSTFSPSSARFSSSASSASNHATTSASPLPAVTTSANNQSPQHYQISPSHTQSAVGVASSLPSTVSSSSSASVPFSVSSLYSSTSSSSSASSNFSSSFSASSVSPSSSNFAAPSSFISSLLIASPNSQLPSPLPFSASSSSAFPSSAPSSPSSMFPPSLPTSTGAPSSTSPSSTNLFGTGGGASASRPPVPSVYFGSKNQRTNPFHSAVDPLLISATENSMPDLAPILRQ